MGKMSLLIRTFVVLSLLVVPVFAYTYSHPGYAYQYPQYYTFFDRSLIADNSLTQYSKVQQPQIFEEREKYDEFFKIGKNGRILRTVSSETTRRYIGSTLTENYLQQLDRKNVREVQGSIPANSYYYPRYGSGYYDWSYRAF